MTDARSLTIELSGKWHGRYGVAPCPVCQSARRKEQNALTLSDGDNRLLVHCKKSSCDFRDIATAAGIMDGTYTPPDPALHAQREAMRRAEAAKRSRQAKAIWSEAQPISGTVAEAYLRGRCITCALPNTLRYHPAAWHGATAKRLPALVALVDGGDGFAVHRTYLRPDGLGKAGVEPAKAMLGATSGGAVRVTEGDGPLVITEGVFGMSGDLGDLKGIAELKKKFNFRLFVDDAHGIGTMGAEGRGAGEELDCQDEIDVYFGTFAKSFASIGAFISSTEDIVEYLRYNMRSQIFAKSLPMPLVIGAIKRLEIMRRGTEQKDKLWAIANVLQAGLKNAGFELGNTQSAVTPVYLSGGVGEATNLTFDLRENYSIFCSIVTYPVVPKGVILLRLIPTAVHTIEEVEYTIKSFSEIKVKLAKGEYISEEIANV